MILRDPAFRLPYHSQSTLPSRPAGPISTDLCEALRVQTSELRAYLEGN